MTAQRKIYVKPIRVLYQEFLTVSSRSSSFSTFPKYKPFYVKLPTEREMNHICVFEVLICTACLKELTRIAF